MDFVAQIHVNVLKEEMLRKKKEEILLNPTMPFRGEYDKYRVRSLNTMY